jgi:hypothetical protein
MSGRQSLGASRRRNARRLSPIQLLNFRMSSVPNHHERQFMQLLRGRGWVESKHLPNAPRTITNLLRKRWIEMHGGGGAKLAIRITEEGLAAKRAPIPLKKGTALCVKG